MGIKVEFNPDLALRAIEEYKKGKRAKEECIPTKLSAGKKYSFLKNGQRHYSIGTKTPLVETKGGEKISMPLASIRILEVTHFQKGDAVFTKGTYIVDRVLSHGWVDFGGYGK
jgi:hypothetical protein